MLVRDGYGLVLIRDEYKIWAGMGRCWYRAVRAHAETGLNGRSMDAGLDGYGLRDECRTGCVEDGSGWSPCRVNDLPCLAVQLLRRGGA